MQLRLAARSERGLLWRRVGSVHGVDLWVHATWWLLLFGTVLPLLIVGPNSLGLSTLGALTLWLSLGLAIALSALVHELGHAYVGYRLGLRPVEMRIFGLGTAVVHSTKAVNPSQRALVSAAGPVGNLLLAALAFAASTLFTPFSFPHLVLAGLAALNVGYGLVNLAPYYPQDGGQLLHSLFWWVFGDEFRGLRTASAISLALSALTLVACAWLSLSVSALGGLLLAVQTIFVGASSLRAFVQARREMANRRDIVDDALLPVRRVDELAA